MSALDHLRTMAQGKRPSDQGLLGNALCAWGQDEIHAEESILAAFAAKPFDLGGEVLALELQQGAAVAGTDEALVADVYAGRIGRLWRVGSPGSQVQQSAVDVAFDTDMRQERGDLCFRAEDHPELAADAQPALTAAIRDLIERERTKGNLRVRAFVVRAFGSRAGSVALLSLFSLSNDTIRAAGFRYAMVHSGPGGDRVVVDPAAARKWTAHL